MYKHLTHFGLKKQMVFSIRWLPRCSAGLPFGRSSVAKMQGRCATYEAEEYFGWIQNFNGIQIEDSTGPEFKAWIAKYKIKAGISIQ